MDSLIRMSICISCSER